MKFQTEMDQSQYQRELAESGLDEVGFIKRRSGLVGDLKNFKKSSTQKQNWRTNRWKYMQGIKRFHKSTEGKKFHRELGRFIASREFRGTLSQREAQDLVKPVSSILTHAYVEFEYYIPLHEAVDYEIFVDEVYTSVLGLLGELRKEQAELDAYSEFLCRICETASVVKALADKSGKSVSDVESKWNDIKKGLIDGGKSEDDDNFYAILVSTLKKSLGLS